MKPSSRASESDTTVIVAIAETPLRGQRDRALAPDDDVNEDTDFEQCKPLLDALRDADVRHARVGSPLGWLWAKITRAELRLRAVFATTLRCTLQPSMAPRNISTNAINRLRVSRYHES